MIADAFSFAAADRSDQEIAGAHGDVGYAKIEQRLSGIGVVERVDLQ